MPKIILCTLNARYIHTALGLRYLKANLGELEEQAVIREFTLDMRPLDIAEKLLAEEPRIIGFGVYIWNVEQTRQLIAVIRQLRPEIHIVLGGPEVSHEWQGQTITRLADYLICGQGDLEFARLCQALLRGDPPPGRVIEATMPPLEQLQLPYRLYDDEDIANRVIYVEASRGCPFKCEFCLSALDKTAWPFPLEPFLDQLDRLYRRGVRHFKFVDRTFNLDPRTGSRILGFFLDRLDPDLFLHFEMIPDRLPGALKEILPRFPAGTLQFEVGIQSLNPEVQQRISRRQDNRRSAENLAWLRDHTQAHIHADLIFGLPGEDVDSIAHGFDRLLAMRPHEIQLGLLKRLRGSPIIRHTEAWGLRFNPNPPYEILCSSSIDFPTMQRLARFSRYWDMIANSGRFRSTLPLILGDSPFARFMALSDWLYAATGQVHRIALKRLFQLLRQGSITLGVDPDSLHTALAADFAHSGLKGALPSGATIAGRDAQSHRHARRQARHR